MPGDLKSKRIFIGFNNAGALGIRSFTRVLRDRGYKTTFYGFSGKWLDSGCDVVINKASGKFWSILQGLFLLIRVLPRYDIFHFNFCKTFSSYKLDHLVLKFFGKKIVHTFRGGDVHDGEKSIKEDGRDSYHFYLSQRLGHQRYEAHRRRRRFIERYSDKITLIGPWLVDSVERFDCIIPYSRDIDAIRKYKSAAKPPSDRPFTIIHAPTDPEVKGTQFVIDAVNRLRRKGLKINLVLPDRVSRKELLTKVASADLAIDQLLVGWYGGFAVEAMALEKPVVCFLKDKYKELVPFGGDIPIINANRRNLDEVLEKLVHDRKRLRSLGKQGYRFVEKYHDANVVASKYEEIYRRLL